MAKIQRLMRYLDTMDDGGTPMLWMEKDADNDVPALRTFHVMHKGKRYPDAFTPEKAIEAFNIQQS